MKKRYSIILAVIMSLSALLPINAVAAETSDNTYKNYDFNSDGLVNGDDIMLLIDRCSEITTNKDELLPNLTIRDNIDKNGDTNEDGQITMLDALGLYKYIHNNNIMGDVNCDGIVDGKDASCVLGFYARRSLGDSELKIGSDLGVALLGDFDGNDIIDARDATAILGYYANNSVQ